MGEAVVLMPAKFTVMVDTIEIECQVSEATVSFDVTTATIKTLCGEADLATSEKGKLTLAGYQDFTEADGLCNFLWENALSRGDVSDHRTDDAGNVAELTGNMQCRRPPFGPASRRRGEILARYSRDRDPVARRDAGAGLVRAGGRCARPYGSRRARAPPGAQRTWRAISATSRRSTGRRGRRRRGPIGARAPTIRAGSPARFTARGNAHDGRSVDAISIRRGRELRRGPGTTSRASHYAESALADVAGGDRVASIEPASSNY